MKCEELAAHKFGDEVKIESANTVAATAKAPAHCDVRGVIWPEARFAIKLPDAWNDRFQMVGNGGTAGVISFGAMDNATAQGFRHRLDGYGARRDKRSRWPLSPT